MGTLTKTYQILRGERPLSVVMYHSVSRAEHPFAVDPASFRDQLRFLSDHYPIVPLRDAEAILKSPGCERVVALTFDDAYRDFADAALPVLEAIRAPATLFVPTGLIGKSNLWDVGRTRVPRIPVVDAARLRTLACSPLIDFGSHSIDHLSMRLLDAAEMSRQAVESRAQLETLLQRRVTMFAYPYGTLSDFSATTTRALAEAGYRVAVTTHWGSTNSLRRLLGMKRICFASKDGTKELRGKVEGDYDWIAIKEWLGFALRWLNVRRTD